jgi:BirA family biotin operon repressor/biotin-[acetyl-CoA-carboxylase] ligase
VELREFRAELPSTQTEAVRRAREGAVAGTRVVAGRQTAGRGRVDHTWASPDGGLYVSVILRGPRGRPTLLPLAVGARLRSGLAGRYGVETRLKWPNDLVVPGPPRTRKLAGILVDRVDTPTLGVAAVVGIGVNVASPPDAYPADVRERVVGLGELSNAPPILADVEDLAVRAAESAVLALSTASGASQLLEEIRSALYAVGRPAKVDRTLAGIIRTVGEEGELLLETPSGGVAVHAGDLAVEEP